MNAGIKNRLILIASLLALAGIAEAVDPYIGYVYPAGGRAGDTVEVLVGGQRLRRVQNASITGEGVEIEALEWIEPALNKFRRLKNEKEKVLQEIEEKKAKGLSVDDIKIPEVPRYRRDPRAQPNAQIAEGFRLKISIAKDAKPGEREIRLTDQRGTSNPIRFHVGTLREAMESPRPEKLWQTPPPAQAGKMPVLLNGRIMPGETDAFRFKAKKGQKIVFITHARSLVPYLADAVPGWFQAVLSVHDDKGKELAYVDDYKFNPDPVLFFEPEADGEYELRIRDSIYRGREDFVYRISMGELPFVDSIFPLGVPAGKKTAVKLSGMNLKDDSMMIDATRVSGSVLLKKTVGKLAQVIPYAVDELPETFEKEPNNSRKRDQAVSIPCVINGRISERDDEDVFSFTGKKGDEVVAEVFARRLNSPLDSIVTISNSKGEVIASNDDHVDRSAGLLTHHADSYVKCALPSGGRYSVAIRDIQKKSGQDYAYRLRLGVAKPDFALRVVPANVSVPMGGSVPVTVHVLRKDGFDGEVRVKLDKSPMGLTLDGVIPAGESSARLTLGAGKGAQRGQVSARVVGVADIAGDQVKREGVPADDRMQAFLWRFLVPAQDWAVTVRAADKVRLLPQLANDDCLKIPAGDSADFTMKLQVMGKVKQQGTMTLGLDDPPAGLSMQPVEVSQKTGQVALSVDADEEVVKVGDKGHLIVSGVFAPKNLLLGMSRAIPYEIVE